jgi:hypothetical protein
MQAPLLLEIFLNLIKPILSQSEPISHDNLSVIEEEQKKNTVEKTIQTMLPPDVIIQRILPLAPQLGTTCREYRDNLPKIFDEDKGSIKFPSVKNKNPVYIKHERWNLTFEYEAKFDLKKLNKLIEHDDVRNLRISQSHPIFIEIRKIFKMILEGDRSVIERWEYKYKFIDLEEKYDGNIDSFVANFICILGY